MTNKSVREILEKVYWWNRRSSDGDDEEMFAQAISDLKQLIPSEKRLEAIVGDIIESWVINKNDETIDKISEEVAKAIRTELERRYG